jgi:hypothetical protein
VLFDRTTGLAALEGRDVEVETSALALYRLRNLWHSDVLANDLRQGRWSYVVVLRPDAGVHSLFANDLVLDAALRSRYRCGRRLPLDSAGTAFTSAEVELCQAVHAR